MPLSFPDAAEIAWTALLDEVGEPPTPSCHDFEYTPVFWTPGRRNTSAQEESWHVAFLDSARPQRVHPSDQVVARVWVDKRTGHTNVWVNEDYDPGPPRPSAVATG